MPRALAAVILAELLACSSSPQCSATSCPTGCCDSAGSCHPGTETAFCGTGGAACTACTGGPCANKSCEGPGDAGLTCGPQNCEGCCAGTRCVVSTGQSASQCGQSGAACQACPNGDTCDATGACVAIDAGTDGGSDAGNTYDFPCGNTSPCDLSLVCCAAVSDAGVSFSCDPPACPAGSNPIACDGPEECDGGAPLCCGVKVDIGGSFPNCLVSSLTATCQPTCPTQIANNCQGTDRVVLCRTSADCPDPSNPKCCKFSSGAAALTFCIDTVTAAFGTCM